VKIVARLLVGSAVAASFAVASPASACDTPPKCASCYVNPDFSLQDPKPIVCYS
jgi:hypothetical protein